MTPPGRQQRTARRVGLAELGRIKNELAERAEQEALALARQKLQENQRAAQQRLFEAAVGPIQRLPPKATVRLAPQAPSPTPRQRMRDEAAALQESLSDEVDIGSLLDTDEQLSFRRPGIGRDVAQKLRRGQWAIQRQADLHGLRSDEARATLAQFINDCHKQGIRCVRVIHGKGLGSPGKAPVLKEKVQRWLTQKSQVLAFVQAPPNQGGAGALLVLLAPLHPSGG
jgi:DNA-nicking Smr family endonuclease